MTIREKTVLGLIIGLCAFVVLAHAYRTGSARAMARVLETAQAAVESMERDGAILSRECAPNVTTIKASMWASLSDRHRQTAARSLALLCEADGTGRSMLIQSEQQMWLGTYGEDDSFQVP